MATKKKNAITNPTKINACYPVNTEGEVSIFALWKEYEKIAMHFNDLIIQLRIKSLGGIAVIAVIVGYISKTGGSNNSQMQWGILATVFIILCFVWIAIWILDLKYYNKMLQGAVQEILNLEKLSGEEKYITDINLSTSIDDSVQGYNVISNSIPCTFWNPCNWFYLIVFSVLSFCSFVFTVFSFINHGQ